MEDQEGYPTTSLIMEELHQRQGPHSAPTAQYATFCTPDGAATTAKNVLRKNPSAVCWPFPVD
jgi:hypothetical protein